MGSSTILPPSASFSNPKCFLYQSVSMVWYGIYHKAIIYSPEYVFSQRVGEFPNLNCLSIKCCINLNKSIIFIHALISTRKKTISLSSVIMASSESRSPRRLLSFKLTIRCIVLYGTHKHNYGRLTRSNDSDFIIYYQQLAVHIYNFCHLCTCRR